MDEEIITSYSEVSECMLGILTGMGIEPIRVESSTHSIYFTDEKTKQDFVFTLDTVQEELINDDDEWEGPGIGTELIE